MMVRQSAPPTTPPILFLLTDTVGFINRLPHALVASFRSTLDEVQEASLRLFVVDASDSELRKQVEVSEQVVRELGASEAPSWVLLNKVDLAFAGEREALAREFPQALQVSAYSRADGAAVRDRIIAFFDQQMVTAKLTIPYANQNVLAELRDQVRVVSEEYGEVITVELRSTPDVLARMRKRLKEAS